MDKIPYEMGVFLICVDAWSPGNCSGRFSSAALGESGTFRDLTRLLMRLDRCLEDHGVPQSFCAARCFSPLTALWHTGESSAGTHPGELATFHVRVRFRRNASWQGTVTWLERRQTMHFRSALELLGLMDSALSDQALTDAIPLRMEG